jgi:glycosyltransferase involved in cell wall biosynthesis
MRIAIIEPFFGGSHAAWANGYQQFSAHDVGVVAHTDRFWKWRMHGSHVTLAGEFMAAVEAGGPFEAIVCSSMLNVPGFLGLARSALKDARVVLYMHENQLGYPLSPRDRLDLTYPMINWTSMLAADHIVFNSQFHHDQWFEDIPRFLRQFPDYQQHGLIADVAARSSVLPVGVDLRRLDGVEPIPGDLPRIIWNQRWEYDKGPRELADAIAALNRSGADFELILAGEQMPSDPDEFVQLQDELGDRIIHYGWAEPAEYERLLASANVVVSTAHHEFFGISITEAIYAGAFPLLPKRLVYPERIPSHLHARCLFDGPDELVEKLVWATGHDAAIAEVAGALRPLMAEIDWQVVAPQYDAVFAG